MLKFDVVSTLKSDVVSKLKSDVETTLKMGYFPDIEINNVVLTLKIGCTMSRPKINLNTTLGYECCCFRPDPPRGRSMVGQKKGSRGPLLQQTSSSDRKATSTNRMHSSDLEACWKKCCYFWFHSEVKFLTRIWRLIGLSRFCEFSCYFYRFVFGQVHYQHLFCVISMFISGRLLI